MTFGRGRLPDRVPVGAPEGRAVWNIGRPSPLVSFELGPQPTRLPQNWICVPMSMIARLRLAHLAKLNMPVVVLVVADGRSLKWRRK
jgi:hypothetical protein